MSPFVKTVALERVLDAIPDEATTINCVARWRPEEIAAGVCDVEIYDLIKSRPGARLFIHPLLHAKLFRVDELCLLGSANLTQRALGWAVPSNLELMFEASANAPTLREFEQELFAQAFEASGALRREMASASNEIWAQDKHHPLYVLSEESISEDKDSVSLEPHWLPLCPQPSQLFDIYVEQDTEKMISSIVSAGKKDLQSLKIPYGLPREAFHKFVAASIQQAPVMQLVRDAARAPISPTSGENLLASNGFECAQGYSYEVHWDNVKNWLLYFLTQDYLQPYGSGDLWRGRKIGEWRG